MTAAARTGVSVLAVRDVVVSFGGNRAVDSVSCSVERGEIFGIIGPNGAGKSTFLNTIAGLVTSDSGEVWINDRDVTSRPFWQRCRSGLAMTFQTPRYDDTLTAAEQILGQLRGAFHVRIGPKAKQHLERIRALLAEMELQDVADRPPSELTLGEVRRFEFARALANEPDILLVDEPSSGMTADETKLLARTLRAISGTGVAVLVIEHNIPFIRALAGQTMVLDAGFVIEQGPTADVLERDSVKEAYLGVAHDAS